MKRLLSLLLAMAMVLSVGVSAFAVATSATITMADAQATKGATVKVTVKLADNPGMTGLTLVPSYDKTALELTKIENGTVFTGADGKSEPVFITTGTEKPADTKKALWYGAEASSDNGDLMVMTFTVLDAATVGTNYPVTVNCEEALDASTNDFSANVADATCKITVVEAPAVEPGDLDGVEGVNNDDVFFLLNHIMMPDFFPLPEGAVADYDGSGATDNDDVFYLLNHIMMPDFFPLNPGAQAVAKKN